MSASNVDVKTPAMLELLNKQLARSQARAINKGLTQLKKISDPPTLMRAPMEADKTGKFITVPVNNIQADTIEHAHEEAVKTCTDSGIALEKAKRKKKWFKWG